MKERRSPPLAPCVALPHVPGRFDSPSRGWNWRTELPWAAALFLLVGVAFAGSIANGHVYDDIAVIRDNPRLAETWDLKLWFTARNLSDADGDNGLYRPLAMWSYALDQAAFGAGPFGVHLVNVLLNALAAVAAYALVRQLGCGRRLAFATTLVWGLHPVHTEVVANGVGRAELGAALCALLAGALHLLWLRPRQAGAEHETAELSRAERRRQARGAGAAAAASAAETRKTGLLVGALCLYFAALCFKESAATLPGLLFLLDWLVRERGAFRPVFLRAGAYLLYALPLALFLVLRHSAVGGMQVALQDVMAGASTSERVLYALETLAKYLGQLCAPLLLCADYSDYTDLARRSVSAPGVLAAFGVFAALGAALWWSKRRGAWLVLAGAAWFFLAILPTSNLLFPIGTVRADRLLFLPSFGFALVLGAGFEALVARRRVLGWTLLALLAGAYGWRTHVRNLEWRSGETLWAATVRQNPGSAVAWYSHGDELARAGRRDEAEAAWRKAFELRDGAGSFYPEAHNRLAQSLVDRGDRAGALAEYRLVVAKSPRQHTALCNLGQLLMGDAATRAEALQLLRRAAEVKPADHVSRANLAQALWFDGRAAEAQAAIGEALRLRPGEPALLQIEALVRGPAPQSTSGGR